MAGDTFEHVVVGGGPAGCAAARHLAAAGRRVMLVDAARSGRRASETLPPAARSLLQQLGIERQALADAHCPCPGTLCVWGSARPYFNDYLFDPDGDGWAIDRGRFDATLRAAAVAAGAELVSGGRVLDGRRDGGEWALVVEVGRERRSVRTSSLIDAAGRRAWPGRPTRRHAVDRQVALVALYAASAAGDGPQRRTGIESAPDGWWYVGASPGGWQSAAHFTDSDLLVAPRAQRRSLWESLLVTAHQTRERLHGTGPLVEVTLVAASSTLATPIASDGYVAVGDAASTVDPLSSHGVTYAIETGLEAAGALLSPQSAQALRSYALGVGRRFAEDLLTRRAFHTLERRWPHSEFWKRRHAVPAVLARGSTAAGLAARARHPSEPGATA